MVLKKGIDKYAHFVSNNAFLVLIGVVILFLVAAFFSSRVEVETMDNSGILPDDLDVMKSMNLLSDMFGGTSSAMIILEVDPQYVNSTEPRDIRSPDVLVYQEQIQDAIYPIEDVLDSTSSSNIFRLFNNESLPKTKVVINELSRNPSFNNYISPDRTMAIIRVSLSDDFDSKELATELQFVIDSIPSPHGIKVSLGGSSMTDGVLDEIIEPDMSKTSTYSMIGIFVVLIFVAGSLRYGLIPLTTIIFGLVWAMGFIGMFGKNLNTASSSVISMIMGIGIDFGIQISTRFREERKKYGIEKAMTVTMESVLYPMVITTLAAVIGFWSMGLGNISVLGDMGEIMSYGVVACLVAAITVVPSIIILSEKILEKKRMKKA